MNITLRPATAADRQFVQDVYFETYRWVLEEMYGWNSDDNESIKFGEFYRELSTQIISVDDQEAGFMTLLRRRTYIEIQCLFLRPQFQNRGIGTQILQGIVEQADAEGMRLSIGTHKINPAKRLYERLGFVVTRESHYRIDFVYPDPFTRSLD